MYQNTSTRINEINYSLEPKSNRRLIRHDNGNKSYRIRIQFVEVAFVSSVSFFLFHINSFIAYAREF